MTFQDTQPAPEPSRPRNALELRQQSYMLQTGLAKTTEKSESDEAAFTVRDIFALVVKHKWILISTMLLSMLVASLAYLTSVPVYQATATIQIDRIAKIVQFNKDVDPFQEDDGLMLQTQYELLRSRSVAERVADDLNLDNSRARRQEAGLAPVESAAQVASGAAVEAAAGAALTGKNSLSERDKQSRDMVVGSLMGAVMIDPVKNSRLVRVKISHTNPAQAARIANTYTKSYIMLNMERRMQSSEYARTFLDEQIKITKAKLEESERALNTYAKDNSILTLDEKTNVVNQAYSEYSGALFKVEQERLKAEAVYNAVAANPENSVPVLESKSVQSYKEQKAKLEAEYANNLSTFKAEFPKMVQLKAQITEIDSRIKAEAAAVLESVKSQLEAAKRQEEQVRSRLKDSRKEVLTTQDKSVDLNLIKRELDTNRQIYDSLLQRMKEVGVTSGVSSNNISVVDEAQVPGYPIAPNLNRNLAAGFAAGLVLSALLIFIREQLDDSIKRVDEVEAKLGVPLLGVIPQIKKKQQTQTGALAMLTIEDQRGAFAEAYRSTRTALQFSTPEGAPRRLMVTSSVASEGKSTTALALAINFAQMGRRVLLIDADMRNPSLHKALDVANEQGLSTYLSGAKREIELLQSTQIPNLMFMAAGPHPPSPVDLLMGPRLLELLDYADRAGFDNIVIDSPPVLGIADSIVLGNQVQNILYAIKCNDTRLSRINDALRRLRLSGLMPLGVVLTSVTSEQSQYYGYYGYGYGTYGAQNPVADTSQQLTNQRGGRA